MAGIIEPATTLQAIHQGPPVLRPAQVRQLLAAPDRRRKKGKRDAALLGVLAGGGLRIGEAVRLTVEQVEQATSGRTRLLVRTGKQRNGSPPKYRTVTLPRQCARLVRGWLDYAQPRWFLFPGRHGEHLSVRAAESAVSRHLRAAGCDWAHPHTLRHSFATIAVRQTRNIWTVSKVLGHADIRTTAAMYCHADPSDADAAADAVTVALSARKRAI